MTDHTAALEAGILARILLRPETINELPALEPDDFFDLRNRAVFAAMRNLEARSLPIDVVTVVAEVAKLHGHSDNVNLQYLGTLTLDTPGAEDAREYARQLHQLALARRLTVELSDVLATAKRTQMDGHELLSAALAVLSKADAEQADDARPISRVTQDRLRQLMQIAEDRATGKSTMTGFPTGVEKLDTFMGGVQPGIVTIVAGRPGMGKSSFGLSIADGASAAGFGVHLFSLEDTEEAYADRAISRSSGVPAEDLRNARIEQGQRTDLARAVTHMRGRRWIVDGRSGITADELVRSVRRHRKENATNVVIVDYIQLVKRPPRISPHEALSEIVTTLADAAKHDRMAYVVMSQLNRDIEKRQDKRPHLSDLRESGSLEERAKCVIGLYRGAYYGGPQKGIDYGDGFAEGHVHCPTNSEHAATVQLDVLKNSNGRTGTVWARWDGPTTRIS